jgi:hypothetical protein
MSLPCGLNFRIKSTPLYIAVCYDPPEGLSTHANPSAINPVEELSLAAAAIQELGGEILIGREFNARTGTNIDMFLDDHEVHGHGIMPLA